MFNTHILNDIGSAILSLFKTKLSVAVTDAMSHLPEGSDKDAFVSKVEEAVMYGVKAIASNPEHVLEVIEHPETVAPLLEKEAETLASDGLEAVASEISAIASEPVAQ